jgi:hypothetical protein
MNNKSRGLNYLRWTIVFIFLGVSLGITGCKPSSSAAQDAIQDEITKESNGRISVSNFQKTNGQEAEPMGIKTYVLEYTATIRFEASCRWQRNTFHTSASPTPASNTPAGLMDAVANPGIPVTMGQGLNIQGTVTFVKKDSGWTAIAVSMTHYNDIYGQIKGG